MNTNKKIKLIGAILGITLFIALIAGITYAAFSWQSDNINISGTSECFTINYTKGPTINNESVILFDESQIINNNKITVKNGMALTGLTASIDSSCSIQAELTITLSEITLNDAYKSTGESTGAFKYVIANYDPNTYSTISIDNLKENNFDIIASGSITEDSSQILLSKKIESTTKGYLIIFYVDGDLALNDAQDSTFSAKITGTATQTE